jgi:hypothetical protein
MQEEHSSKQVSSAKIWTAQHRSKKNSAFFILSPIVSFKQKERIHLALNKVHYKYKQKFSKGPFSILGLTAFSSLLKKANSDYLGGIRRLFFFNQPLAILKRHS